MAIFSINAPFSDRVQALYTDRQGGLSQSVFDSMNLGSHVGDDVQNVQKNRGLLQKFLGLEQDLCWLEQIHSCTVVKAQRQVEEGLIADASWSDEARVACVVMTADCLPILVSDKQGRKVAAIHAGWRGLCAGVIESTFAALGTGDWQVWLGPAIGKMAFEVGAEVRALYLKKSPKMVKYFAPKNDTQDKFLADMYGLASEILHDLGIYEIYQENICTYSDPNFYSYRRDGQTGRMATVIMIR
ncbi:Laccase domain protein YfiH [Piscirickettsia salmonis]|uniref:Purine nucleoside phosphorylase n=1 Tax=Piscirickettsia salmonis TaxID=1238 RepID=A0A1L6TCE1_PISSA|nr:peptidoglycan editing factor PgeF [Piscirickettsia salmonis]AKP74163.1 laccase [Piscirickettsia salmonis LF-89 = ATCC VR-1361]ALB23044.1 laccase [Piscirickettsia salmonis]ALY02981.1 laccase [Piscirickettsia salmonis]AMA42537.1 laccase [Piscirickettsia salmonis]AOS35007.1 laccase [Piscirickettsia salmonis]